MYVFGGNVCYIYIYIYIIEFWFYIGIYMSSIFGWVGLDFLVKY